MPEKTPLCGWGRSALSGRDAASAWRRVLPPAWASTQFLAFRKQVPPLKTKAPHPPSPCAATHLEQHAAGEVAPPDDERSHMAAQTRVTAAQKIIGSDNAFTF
jgi:hypothetical protein